MRAFNLVKSLTNLVTNFTPSLRGKARMGLRLLILCLSLAIFGVNDAWADWIGTESKQIDKNSYLKNGQWYVSYGTSEQSIGVNKSKTVSLQGPGDKLKFDAKRQVLGIGNLKVASSTDGSNFGDPFYDQNPGTVVKRVWGVESQVDYATYGEYSLSKSVTTLKFYTVTGASLEKFYKNVNVTMANYLGVTAVDKTSVSHGFGSAKVNEADVSQTFRIYYCNGGGYKSGASAATTLNISNSNSTNFSVNATSKSISAGSFGYFDLTVTYNHSIAGNGQSTTITISDGGSYSVTITATGTTTKLDPSITWSSDDATFNVDDVLSATNSNGLTVTLSSTGNEQYVNCSGNTATMLEATTGTITITANVTGNDIYNSKSFTKDITITNKEKQYITWKQDFSKLKTTDANKNITLNAEAVDKDGNKTGLPVSYELVGDKTGLSLSKNGNTWTLTYSASACKNTTIIAKQEGNATYAPASNYSLPVKVVDPTQTCSTTETVINSSVNLENTSVYYNIDIPETMKIEVKRSKTGWSIYTNGFDVELYSGINATGTRLSLFTYSANDINNSKTISLSDLNINAKSVKLISHASNGYTVTSLTYTHYHYCNTDKTELNYATYPNTKTDAKQVVISYANYPIEIECSSNKIGIDKSSFGDCGVAGSETINVTYTTGANTGNETEYIYVKDNTGATLKTITINVSIQKVSQNITSTSIVSSYKTTDKIELSATSNSGLTNFEYSCSPSDVASFEGNIMTFNKSCDNLSIMVTQPGDNVYSPCSTTVNNIKVSKVTPTISTNPTATITYGQQLNTVTLSGGAAKVNPFRGLATDHAVEGTFSWTNGGYTVIETGGTTHEYDVTFTPSGTEAGMYNSVQGKATVTVNKATPTLTTQNPADTKIYIDDTLTPKIDLVSCITGYSAENDADGHTQDRSAITYACEQKGAVIEDKKFYATAAGTYTVTATAPATDYYEAVSKTITIVVGKHTPVFSWKTFEHIYAGQILEDVASTSYNDKPVTLDKTYESLSPVISLDEEDNAKLHVSPTLTEETVATIRVTTTETSFYKSVTDTHSYTLEPKATPVFYLNDNVLTPEETTDLHLEIGQTANVRFELTDESKFEYPTPTHDNYFTYNHNAENHTGVITASKYGDETFTFHQQGTSTIFDHLCKIHIYVSKHQSVLTTPLTDGTWKVDSLYTGSVYSSNDTHEVLVSTSNDKVLKVTEEGIKAVGAGSATLYIRQKATDEWTGDTISVNINVEKYTPEITWNLEANLSWGSVIDNPVSSTNTDVPFTVTSNNPQVANFVNNRIEVYNTSGVVTYTFNQEGNYKWNAAISSKTITVFQPANHVPFTLSQGNYGNFVNSYNKECTWDGGLRVASTAAKYAFNWDDRYVILHFEGIPDKLYFSCSNSNASTGIDYYVCEGSSQSNLTQIWSASKATQDVQIQLQPNTRYIKLCFSGNYAGYFSNVQVTERKEISAPTSCNLGTANVGSTTSKQNISIDWYNVQTCSLTISGTDADRFSVNPTSIASSLDNYGKESIEISYLHTISGSHSATLHIQSADDKSATVALSGTTNKVTPTITWIENLSPMEKGSTKENPAQAGGLMFTYESSDPSVIEIVNGNTLHALKKGKAEITANFDGTHDIMWNSASAKTTIEVTDIKVLRIDWPQSFSNLKTDKPNVPIQATIYYYNFEDSTTIAIDRPILFESQNTNVVSIVEGCVHVVGKGETTITATVEGVEDEYIGTTVTRKVKVREPSEGCDMYVLEDANGSLFTEISSFSGVEKVIDLAGEPGYITFDAWSEKWYLINPSGNLKLAAYYDGSYHTIWDQTLNVGSETSYGPIALNRKTTKIKFFKEVGSTCYHNFASAYVTLAKYLELDNTQGKTTMNVDFPEAETNTGITYTKYVDVNFSNISDVLDVVIKHGTYFTVLSNDLSDIESIGEGCGDKGKVTLAIQFLSNDVDNYKDTIIISNKDQSAIIYLSAEVARHDQQITWNPNTNLLTTDQVTFSATTTATDLHVSYAVKGTSDVASVTPDGELTIHKYGQVTIIASQAGSKDYKPAENVEYTFNISRATPTITTPPVATEVILPKTLAGCSLSGGIASVSGTFAWANTTTQIERGNTGYEVIFTPDNQDYYNTATCVVIVPVAKDPQTITWNFNETTMYCNAQITFDATASSGLPVEYTTSNSSIAYVDDSHKLCIIKGGEVTITAKQAGNETWAAAPDVNKALTIKRFTPTIVENPIAQPMLIGQLLSNASLSGGRAELNSQSVPGTFAWENGNSTTINEAGVTSRTVIFTPQNSNYYESVSCEVEVEVKKYAPEITHNLTASTITYGQDLSASILSGSIIAKDKVKYPNVEVEGTFGWLYPTLVLNAGEQKAIVRFSPTNSDWYNYVDLEISIQVNKATADATPLAAAIEYGQKVSESILTNEGTTEGTWSWTDEKKTQVLEVGTHEGLKVHFTPTDQTNYNEIDGTVSLTITGVMENVFSGEGDWNDPKNWTYGVPTSDNPDVVISGNMTIGQSISVGSLTIEAGGSVTIVVEGDLTVNGTSKDRDTYGNLFVRNGGDVTISENANVKVFDFVVESSIGTEGQSVSGQVKHSNRVLYTNGAYIDINMDPSGKMDDTQWYAFTVPFPVDVQSGIARKEGDTFRKCTYGVEYMICEYDINQRLNTGKGWKYIKSGKLQPGRFYYFTVNGDYNVYSFKAAENTITINNTTELKVNGTGADANWNAVGNSTLTYTTISGEKVPAYVQTYVNGESRYITVATDDAQFVVGCPFFFQASEEATMILNEANKTVDTHYAPRQESVDKPVCVRIAEEDKHFSDQIYLTASQEATSEYTLGRDLVKAGIGTKSAQLWMNAYSQKLSVQDATLMGDQAYYELSIYAPKAGSYELSLPKVPANAVIYLTQNGYPIWNLNETPYVIECYKGTTNEYGLLLRLQEGGSPTDMQTMRGSEKVQKIMKDQRIYINANTQLYDLMGQKVK